MIGKKIKDISVNKDTSLEELVGQLHDSGGFVAKKVGIAANILENMLSEKDCYNTLSFPAAIISTGCRGIIKDLVRKKLFHMVMTTCGTLDHDFARVWEPYYHGSFSADDRALHEKKIHRLGNIFIPFSNYGEIIEKKLRPVLEDIYKSGKRDLAAYELVWEIGKRLEKEKNKEHSIIWWCWKNQIPVIVPGITDGAFGLQLALFMQDHSDFRVDVFRDEKFLIGKFFGDMKTGALIIGGGISKHHAIWWNQFKGGLDYAVYITTAVEWDGSLSGARPREAVSWGKINEKAEYVTVEGDATALLPLVVGKFL
ncbi:MAG: deoxyhypusine synthase [Candidatus Aenigmarchaeota archaeon]|nr:deoxyhypusine synthase [Candidatus Aenigmarchaeota archaeon]